jgi:FkbM family methyltransferase
MVRPIVEKATALIAARQLDQAEVLLAEALRDDPVDAEALNTQGSLAFQRSRLTDAVDAWERSASADPTLYKPWANLARALSLLGRIEPSLDAAARAVDLAPQLARIAVLHAQLLFQDGRRTDATREARRAVDADPSVQGTRLLARCLAAEGEVEAALALLRETPRSVGSDLGLMIQRHVLEALQGDARGLDRLEEMVRIHPLVAAAAESYAYAARKCLGDDHPRTRLACAEWSAMHSIAATPLREPVAVRGGASVGVVFFHDHGSAGVSRWLPILREMIRAGVALTVFAEGTPRAELARAGLAEATRVLPAVGPREIAQYIARHALDVLIDPVGPTEGAGLRAFAFEPARTQWSFGPTALRARSACFESLFDEPLIPSIDQWMAALPGAVARGRSLPPGARVLPLHPGLRMVLPESLSVMSTFVIAEQGRWFEDEVDFVERLVPEGGVVADIGANFGSYALPMARKIGPTGALFAFEPASHTAATLSASAERNGLSQLRVHRCALGAEPGEVTLVHGGSPELHQIGEGDGERVPCRTLDEWSDALRGLVFLKLDAEGSESRILQGGEQVLTRERPVVMFELTHGSVVNTALIRDFERRGFAVFSLWPGLSALLPFDPTEPDNFQLNLFGVTPDRAAQLAREGMLLNSLPDSDPLPASWEAIEARWRAFAFAREIPWISPDEWTAQAIFAGDPSRPLPARAAALNAAARRARAANSAQASVYENFTAARILRAAGRRTDAIDRLRAILLRSEASIAPPTAPFLPALASYESVSPTNWGDWVRAQAFEAWERWSAHTSGSRPQSMAAIFARHRQRGPLGGELSRRLALDAIRFRAPWD